MSKLTKEEIKTIIPHRDPFLFIDEITELNGDSATGTKLLKHDDYFFQGHFPNLPVMPGVLIIESLAQVGAVILLSKPQYQSKIAFFTGIQKAKFRKSVVPGDTLILKCQVTKIRGSFGFGEAQAYVNDELVCEASISFAVGDV